MNHLRAFTIVAVLVAPLAGCSMDIFHDTSWHTACDLDPTTPGCEGDGGAEDGGDGGDGAQGG